MWSRRGVIKEGTGMGLTRVKVECQQMINRYSNYVVMERDEDDGEGGRSVLMNLRSGGIGDEGSGEGKR